MGPIEVGELGSMVQKVAATDRDVESSVRERYSEGARQRVPELCCPVSYDARWLEAIPREVIERDYGCGDPSKHVRSGETVLDLGSGSGKICFIASQVVGEKGRVIGVDMNDDMLQLARKHAPTVADHVGYANVDFRKGKIQDLRLDWDAVEHWLAEHPIRDAASHAAFEDECTRLRNEQPLVADGSVDVVVSNCVLNLVRPADKAQMFRELFRVLARGGRAVISDIVCDEDVPVHLQRDPELWSGCISGAFREDQFLSAFEDAGFHGIRILERGTEPWTTVEGIEFRSMTVEAFTGKQGPCRERHQAVIYQGPWREVVDDDGHVLRRGERSAVCDKTYHLYLSEPYRSSILPVPPRVEVPMDQAAEFDCSAPRRRSPEQTKGANYRETTKPGGECEPGCC